MKPPLVQLPLQLCYDLEYDVGMTNSLIDESLFGEVKIARNSTNSGAKPNSTLITPVTKEELLKIKQQALRCSRGTSKERNHVEDEKIKEEKARVRINKIKRLQFLSNISEPESPDTVERIQRENAIREIAAAKKDCNIDAVKVLSTIGTRASAFTLRQKQLEDKKQREAADREYEQRLDIAMEIDRLRALKNLQEKDESKAKRRVEDRRVIASQIKERQRLQMLAVEAREQENQQMRQMMQKYEEEAAVAARRQREETERSRIEVQLANEAALKKKEDTRKQTAREVAELLAYQRERDLLMKRREEEEEEARQVRAARQAKVLAEQERTMSNSDHREELLMRRFAEEKIRLEREKDKQRRLKRLEEARSLMQSRQSAAEQRRRMQDAERQEEAQAQIKALERAAVEEERERQAALTRAEAALQHREFLQQQVRQAEERRHADRAARFVEGEAMRRTEQQELERLSQLRAEMVSQLQAQGVDPRFLAEMRAVDLEKLLKRR